MENKAAKQLLEYREKHQVLIIDFNFLYYL
jgi:hypothetical protein